MPRDHTDLDFSVAEEIMPSDFDRLTLSLAGLQLVLKRDKLYPQSEGRFGAIGKLLKEEVIFVDPALDSLFTNIESPESSAVSNVASSFGHFLTILVDDKTTIELFQLCQNNRVNFLALESRIEMILDNNTYNLSSLEENPYDTALATYLLVLSTIIPVLSMLEARVTRKYSWMVLAAEDRTGFGGLFWAKRIANAILK